MKLTAKQEMFCREYLKDLNGAQAAVRAGYSPESAKEIASENLTKPNVLEYVQSLMAERIERTKIDADYVINSIHEITERCKQAIPVIVDGQPTGEYRFEPNAALKGCELLGKHLKLFTDKVEASGPNGSPLELTVRYVSGNNNPGGV